VIGPTLVNSVRLQFQLASRITEFDPAVYGTQFVVPISTGGTFTSGTSQSALLLNRPYQVGDTLSAVKGKHIIRFGGDMIYAHTGGNSKEFGGPIYLGQFSYNTCTQALAYCESSAYVDNIANVKSYARSNCVVIGRNAGRGTALYDFSAFIERTFPHITLRAEAFNALNHANFVGFSGTYGNGATAGPCFGAPLVGITNQLPARSLQFSARLFSDAF
jgi:hypothetical protein